MENLDNIRTEEQKQTAANNRAFWGEYFKNSPKRSAGDIALKIARAKVEHGAKHADDWMEKATALKARENA